MKSPRKANRLPGYDYSRAGYYFITVCTQNRSNYLGQIKDDCMKLQSAGVIAKAHWQAIPQYYHRVSLDHFIIMPNHLHGILIIHPPNAVNPNHPVGAIINRPKISIHSRPMRTVDNRPYGLLSQIIKSFKQITTRKIRLASPQLNFAWQRSYYDHIIRNDSDLSDIRHYIQNNPRKWAIDKYHPDNWAKHKKARSV